MAAAPSHKQHNLSVNLEPPRPQYSRQRSNSLPAGLANMNAQEAGMLFSAAERATARRRRPFSIHTPYRIPVVDSPKVPIHQRFDSAETIRPSPPPKDTPLAQPQPTLAPSAVITKRPRTALRDLDINQAMNGRTSPALVSTLKSLPVPVISPTRRQVGTTSLKSYADGLFQFTQTRLVSTIPNVLSPPPTSTADVFSDNDYSPKVNQRSPRPAFESKFSDWSVTTCESRQSMIQEPEFSTQQFDIDPSLMSPDSFFGGFDDTPKRKNFSVRTFQSGYPSSEAYGPQSGEHQPLTPPPCLPEPIVSPVEEFSYFSNYDQYMDTTATSKADIIGATEALESLAIEISPMESSQYLITPPPSILQRANSDLQAPVLSRSCSGTPGYTFAVSSPATPYQLADVAVRIPNWLISSIS
jgi:hypothetical protein